jgi:lipoprotein-releasing system ATP-binding protein
MLVASGLKKKYGKLNVLNGIDIQIKSNEIVSITGDSGAGKSTLLHILGTLDQADTGSIMFEGKDISTLSTSELAAYRNRKMGFVFQFHHLLPEFTAIENVMLPALIAKESKKNATDSAKNILTILGLENRMNHKPNALSGGEQQRVSVARALINGPQVVFADEPTGNLDSKNALELYELFIDLKEKLDTSFVIVTHNQELANMADRCLNMQDGLISKS